MPDSRSTTCSLDSLTHSQKQVSLNQKKTGLAISWNQETYVNKKLNPRHRNVVDVVIPTHARLYSDPLEPRSIDRHKVLIVGCTFQSRVGSVAKFICAVLSQNCIQLVTPLNSNARHLLGPWILIKAGSSMGDSMYNDGYACQTGNHMRCTVCQNPIDPHRW